MLEILLAVIAILGPIISGVWSYRSSVKKAESELQAVKEINKNELEKIKIQHEAELEKIKAEQELQKQTAEHGTQMEMLKGIMGTPKVQGIIEKEITKAFGNK